MSRIDHHAVIRVLHAIAADDPDRVDPRAATRGCRYVSHGHPQCLAAEVLVRLGVPVRSVAQLDREQRGRPIELAASKHPAVRSLTGPARELLDFVQSIQDGGRTWGDAVAWATDPRSLRTLRWTEAGR
ncbi:hypothetical protein CDO52_00875 [Nocardiopsis gilva YIM 90087]|uniref:Uncharacterized protein n=1 Tax=Nocardiopsis gilva YIM 90087 TaxID=1235441 RepID=A0A223S076_9ACTN|nr:hypothetical protein [Nocardiopsis gilva]ASU81532.1 hypothetical protein CDO52_00875 [Nocardiopsis gilva YIM 90087]